MKTRRLLGIVPGAQLSAARQRILIRLHREFGLALLERNLDGLQANLASDVVLESQAVLKPLHGAASVLQHLARKLEAVTATGNMLQLWLGVVDLPAAADHPCLVAQQSRARFLFALTEVAGCIERIDILTIAPSPASTRCLERIG